jgi:hypothetical protein
VLGGLVAEADMMLGETGAGCVQLDYRHHPKPPRNPSDAGIHPAQVNR